MDVPRPRPLAPLANWMGGEFRGAGTMPSGRCVELPRLGVALITVIVTVAVSAFLASLRLVRGAVVAPTTDVRGAEAVSARVNGHARLDGGADEFQHDGW